MKPDLKNLPEETLKEYYELSQRVKELTEIEQAHTDFLSFVNSQWFSFIQGHHHTIVAEAFNRIANGKLKRLIINKPPRLTKSEFASFLLPAYLIGRNPTLKIIQATHTADLAVRFGRKVRDLIQTDIYKRIFPETRLHPDSKAAGKWETLSEKDPAMR